MQVTRCGSIIVLFRSLSTLCYIIIIIVITISIFFAVDSQTMGHIPRAITKKNRNGKEEEHNISDNGENGRQALCCIRQRRKKNREIRGARRCLSRTSHLCNLKKKKRTTTTKHVK